MKKPIIKALAMTMAITMAFSTPISVGAAGLADLYNTTASDGDKYKEPYKEPYKVPEVPEVPEVPDKYKDPYKVPEGLEAHLVGVSLDRDFVEVVKNETTELTASVILDNTEVNPDSKSRTVAINAANAAQYENVTIVVIGDDGKEKKYTPEDLLKSIGWRSEDESIVTTDAKENVATITGVKGGETRVTAYVAGAEKYNKSAKVKVLSYTTSLTIKAPEKNFVKHQIPLESLVERKPEDANDIITYSVYTEGAIGKSTSYASIKDGNLVLKKVTNGKKVVLIATAEKGVSNRVAFEIKAGVPITKLSKRQAVKELVIPTRDKGTLSVVIDKVKEGTITTDDITWTSKNPSIVKVQAKTQADTVGKEATAEITALKAGKTTITAMSTSGKKVNFTVTVKAPVTKINDIVIEGRDAATAHKAYSGQKLPLKAIVADADKVDPKEVQKIKFSVDSKSIATISSKGVLSVKKNKTGIVKVTAVSDKGKGNASCTVSITVAEGKVTNIGAERFITQYVKEPVGTYMIKVNQLNPEATRDMLSWSSSNSKVVSVDQNGVITALKAGKAKITVTGYNGSKPKTEKIDVVVKQAVTSLKLNKTAVTVNHKEKGNYSKVNLKVTRNKGADKNEAIRWSIVNQKEVPNVSVTNGKVTIPSGIANGTVIVVQAKSALGGATVRATITVCNATKKIQVQSKTMELAVDGKGKVLNDLYTVVPKSGDSKNNEKIISYTANNANVRIIKDSKGNYTVYGVKKGKTTVTAKTASGKSAKITFKVSQN